MIILQSTNTLRLKQAEEADQENLRAWKNAHRQFFYFKDKISPEMQAKWFAKYQLRKHDVMFISQEQDSKGNWVSTGCMGYRLENSKIDLYNILRGARVQGSPHTMSEAFGTMNAWLHQTYRLPITCEVIASNPACAWYERNSMNAVGKGDKPEAHVVYQLNTNKISNIKVEATYS